LGIPTVKDRVVQMAALLVLAPIFEADFHPNSFGFPGKASEACFYCGDTPAKRVFQLSICFLY
jgi:retron-type reverse transcriptase